MASELQEIVGFFSYSRRDDQHSMGALSRLRARIQSELRLQMGRDFRLWQDTAAIPEGARWEGEINKAIAEALFFIPIVTPSAISSAHCSFEYAAFLKREAALGRDDLIFPILYITVEALDDERQWRKSELLKVIGSRQYLDWRKYRHLDPSSPEVALQIEQFCRNIYKALRRPVVTSEERKHEEHAEAKREADEQPRLRKETADVHKRARDEERRKPVVRARHRGRTRLIEQPSSNIDSNGGLAGQIAKRRLSLQLPQGWRPPPAVLAISAALVVVAAAGFWLATMRSAVAPSSSNIGPLSPEREQALNPKDSFKECANCPEMVVMPAGTFKMGSPADEPGRNADEVQVNVAIARPFAVSKFATTFDEWNACTADGGCNGYAPQDGGWGRGRRPVINVSWNDAQAYVAWLSHKTGRTYRLLSEAEREYVTRAGTTTPFWWGSSITATQADYNASFVYGGGTKGVYLAQTVPVASFAANPWGLYQVHGNVWEWTDDCWNDSNSGNPGNGISRMGGDCGRHVVRGGSWFNSPAILRSASRGNYPTDNRNEGFGFRVARTLNP
jgi:formylglycine-generating enzyme required for sulfatase activity